MIHPSKIIKELGISPLKQLGQNFQVDVHAVENAAHLIPAGSVILEIGPGLGAWTGVFLARGHRMVLSEKDRTLAARLIEQHAENGAVTVLAGDFLELPAEEPALQTANAAIGNLPFYVTSEILLRVIVAMPAITHALFGIQLEVAERITSGRGSSLAIALGSQGKLTMAGKISRNSFYPVPNVDAAILYFERMPAPARPHLRELLKAAFWGKRKTLGSSLRKNPFFASHPVAQNWHAKLDNLPESLRVLLTRRADELTIAEFCAFYDFLTAGR